MIYKRIIRLIAFIEIGIGLATIVSAITYILLSISTKPLNVLVFVLVSAVVSFALGLGLFNYKEWARLLIILFSGYIILIKIMLLFRLLEFKGEITTFIPIDIKNGISILYHSFIILFLTRQSNKGYFQNLNKVS